MPSRFSIAKLPPWYHRYLLPRLPLPEIVRFWGIANGLDSHNVFSSALEQSTNCRSTTAMQSHPNTPTHRCPESSVNPLFVQPGEAERSREPVAGDNDVVTVSDTTRPSYLRPSWSHNQRTVNLDEVDQRIQSCNRTGGGFINRQIAADLVHLLTERIDNSLVTQRVGIAGTLISSCALGQNPASAVSASQLNNCITPATRENVVAVTCFQQSVSIRFPLLEEASILSLPLKAINAT